MRVRRQRLAVDPAETRSRALRAEFVRVAFAAVARVALDERAVVPVQGEVGVDADAGRGGGLFDGCCGGGGGGSAGGVVGFVAAARPGVGFADGGGVALGCGPGCWLGWVWVGGFVCWGELGC